MDCFVFCTQHFWDGGAADVNVHDADLSIWVVGKGVGEHGGKGGFADTAFAGEDEEFVGDGGETGADEGEVWVGAFGSGCADLLVGTAGASVLIV